MRAFFLLIFVTNSYAIGLNETLPGRILEIFPYNILVISRGAEDGLLYKEHIKISSTDGFIARGIVIKRTLSAAFVKIYRVVRPQLVSRDVTYKIRTLIFSEVPEKYQYVIDRDYRQQLEPLLIPSFFSKGTTYNSALQAEIAKDEQIRFDSLEKVEKKMTPRRTLYQVFVPK